MVPPEPPLLDREGELQTLDAALEATRAGQGGVVVLEGAAGTGKSALVALTGRRASSAGLRVLAARGGELEQDHPFGLIRQLYEPLLAAADTQRRARLLAGAAAPAAWVLGVSTGATGVHAAGFAAMQAIYWLTAHVAEEGPLVLTVDDGQWADPSSLRALDFLARRIADLPAMLLVALRPQEPGSRMELLDELRGVAAGRVSLGALGPESVARLVRDRIPEASAEVCDACHTATAGNPLYLQELLRSIIADEVAPDAGTVRQASLPTLGDRVIRRVERVADDAPALARAMAVLGNGTRLAVAAQLAAVPEAQAGRIAHRLRRIELLGAEDPIAFVHPLIRRSVYDAIPETERQATHRQAARLLSAGGAPAEAVAAHLRTLTPSGDASVAAALLEAAERALQRAAVDEAVGWLERALAEDAPDPPRAQLLARLGTARAIQRDPAAIADLREAYELAEDPELRGRVAVTLAELLAHAGQWNAAIDVIESLDAEAGRPRLRARSRGRRDQGHRHAERPGAHRRLRSPPGHLCHAGPRRSLGLLRAGGAAGRRSREPRTTRRGARVRRACAGGRAPLGRARGRRVDDAPTHRCVRPGRGARSRMGGGRSGGRGGPQHRFGTRAADRPVRPRLDSRSAWRSHCGGVRPDDDLRLRARRRPADGGDLAVVLPDRRPARARRSLGGCRAGGTDPAPSGLPQDDERRNAARGPGAPAPPPPRQRGSA